jgi:hypothetical protein
MVLSRNLGYAASNVDQALYVRSGQRAADLAFRKR